MDEKGLCQMHNVLFNYGDKLGYNKRNPNFKYKEINLCPLNSSFLSKEAELTTATKGLSVYHELVNENGSSAVFPGRISSSNQN